MSRFFRNSPEQLRIAENRETARRYMRWAEKPFSLEVKAAHLEKAAEASRRVGRPADRRRAMILHLEAMEIFVGLFILDRAEYNLVMAADAAKTLADRIAIDKMRERLDSIVAEKVPPSIRLSDFLELRRHD